MSKLDEKVGKYTDELRSKIGQEPDLDLLRKVTKGCGPSIYRADSETVAATQSHELDTIKKSFLIKKLGLSESDDLDGAIGSVMEQYGKSNRNKYRAVVYYLLTKHFKKESVYG